MVTAGSNTGRIGELVRRERHPGSFDIIHIKDAADNKFATRLDNVFAIGSSIYHPLISLPKQKGIRLSMSHLPLPLRFYASICGDFFLEFDCCVQFFSRHNTKIVIIIL